MFERPITPEVEPIALDPRLQEVRDAALRYHRDNGYTGEPLFFWDWLDQLSPDDRLSYLLGDHVNRAYDEDSSSRRSFMLSYELTEALGESPREEQAISYQDATLLILHIATTKRQEDISGEGTRTCLYETLLELGHTCNESVQQIADAVFGPRSGAIDDALVPYADLITNFRDIWRRDIALFNKEQRVLYVSSMAGNLAADFETLNALTQTSEEGDEHTFERNTPRSFEALREELNAHRAILNDIRLQAKAGRGPRVRSSTSEEKQARLVNFYRTNPDLQKKALMAEAGLLRTFEELRQTVTPENINDAVGTLLATRPELRPTLPDAIAAMRGHVALMGEFNEASGLSELILRAKDNRVAIEPSERRFGLLHRLLSDRNNSLQGLAADVKQGIEELLLGEQCRKVVSYLPPPVVSGHATENSRSLGDVYQQTTKKLLALLLTETA